MPELTREERIAKALSLTQSEDNIQEETPKQLSREERLARALELSQAEDKKKKSISIGIEYGRIFFGYKRNEEGTIFGYYKTT